MKSHNQQLLSKSHNSLPAPPPITRGSATSSSNGLLFLSKNQVSQQQEALLLALGYQAKEEKDTKTSVWGVSHLKSRTDANNSVKDSSAAPTNTSPPSSLSPSKAEEKSPISSFNRNTNTSTITSANEPDTSSATKSNSTPNQRSVPASMTVAVEDDQVEYMRQLAKERSEKRRLEEEARILEQQDRAAARLLELERNMGVVSSPNLVDPSKRTPYDEFSRDRLSKEKTLFDPYSDRKAWDSKKEEVSVSRTTMATSSSSSNGQPRVESQMPPSDKIINYEDRSSSGSTGPRLLFDPKSGSMIAAPTSNSNNNAKASKEAKKKKKIITSNINDSASSSRERKHSNDVNMLGDNSKAKTPTTNSNHGTSSVIKGITVAASDKKPVNQKIKKRTLPRTCGVLYARDENGNFVSVDGCDGDEGYGYHLFPGGRIINQKAYEDYEKQGFQISESSNYSSTSKVSQAHDSGFKSSAAHLNRSHFMRKSQTRQDQGTSSDNLAVSTLLKGDEKLDLLTGFDESPKLQATAAVWAPSEAVLALTVAKTSSKQASFHSKNASNPMAVTDNEKDHDLQLQNLGESPSVSLGLGFDPTKNMDTVMMSPALNSSIENTQVNLSQLDISNPRSANQIVSSSASSLLGSSPWATGGSNHPSMGSLSDWDFSSHNSKEVDKHSSASFLSFGGLGGTRNTWGST